MAAIAMAIGAATPVVIGIGALCGVVYLLASLWWGLRPVFAFVRDGVPMSPSPGD